MTIENSQDQNAQNRNVVETEPHESQEILSGLSRVKAPESFSLSVETRIRRRSRGRFFKKRAPVDRFNYVIAALLLIIMVLLYLMTQQSFDLRHVEETIEHHDEQVPAEQIQDEGRGL